MFSQETSGFNEENTFKWAEAKVENQLSGLGRRKEMVACIWVVTVTVVNWVRFWVCLQDRPIIVRPEA